MQNKCLHRVRVMVFSVTFNSISAILWRSLLMVEEAGVPRENHWPAASHWQAFSHKGVWSMSCLSSGIRTHNVSSFCIIISLICSISIKWNTKFTILSKQHQNQKSKSTKEAKLILLTHKYMTAHFKKFYYIIILYANFLHYPFISLDKRHLLISTNLS